MTKGSLFFLFTVAGAFACIGVAALASAHESTSHVNLEAGKVYRATSKLPPDPTDRVLVRNGLAAAGAVVESEDDDTVTYVVRSAHTRTLTLGRDGFDFTDAPTGRSVRLVVSTVEAL